MPVAKFIGFWSKDWQQEFKIPKGYWVIKPKESYAKDLGICLNRLDENQVKKGELREMDFTMEYHYRKRTLGMNNLSHALYHIEANEMNANTPGDKKQVITARELYLQDVMMYGDRFEVKIKEDQMELLQRMYKYYEVKKTIGDTIILDVILGTSQKDIREMSYWIERQMNRLAYNNVSFSSSVEIKDYWRKWKQELNDKKIILHDAIMSADEYRKLNVVCEADGGIYLGDGAGQLAHINAKGMGGNAEPWKNYSSNWLHLSHEAHILTQHQKGWGEFLKKYPHLKYKVETALMREYEVLPEWKEDELGIF